jgi:DNA-binding CsgD family transcriptional regulator
MAGMVRLVADFEDAMAKCASPLDLFAQTCMAAGELGFEHVALVQRLAFARPEASLILLENFGAFAQVYRAERYFHRDPVWLAVQRSNAAFAWNDLGALATLGKPQLSILAAASHHGLCAGMSVPMGVPGEPLGCCSFATRASSLPSRECCHTAVLIAMSAFREARRMYGFPARNRLIAMPGPRKLEVLELAVQGKTDVEIGMILGLKAWTIRSYIAELKQSFSVYSRSQLCVAAVRYGFVAFDEARPTF